MKSHKQSKSTSKPTKSVTKTVKKTVLPEKPKTDVFKFTLNAESLPDGVNILCDAEGRNGFAVDVFARVMMEDNNMADILVRAVGLFLDLQVQSKINEQTANEKKTKAKGGSNTAKRKAKAKV
jgi:hypothetical protein